MAFGDRRPASITIEMEEFLGIVVDQVKGTDAMELIKRLDSEQRSWSFTHQMYLYFKGLEEKRLQEPGEKP